MTTQTISTSETRLDALTLQSSAFGLTVPVVGGVARVPGNLLDYLDFKATAKVKTESGKGGVETETRTYSYSASVLMSLGAGRASVGQVWKGKSVFAGGWTGSQVARRTITYAVPASGAMTVTLTNAGTMIGAPLVTCDLGGWVAILSAGVDYKAEGSTLTVLLSAWRGQTLTIAYQYGTTAFSHAGLNELGLSLVAGDPVQSPPAWLSATPDHAIHYPGQAYVHGQDYGLGSSASIENHVFEVLGFGAYRYGSTKPDCNPAEFTGWLLSSALEGAGMPAGTLEVQDWIDACAAQDILLSPALKTQMRAGDLLRDMADLTNAMVVTSYDRIRVIPRVDTAVTANGVTFTPDTTPQYDLTQDHLIGNPPITSQVRANQQRKNHFRLEYQDRANGYNTAVAEAMDDGDIAVNGQKSADTISAPWVTTGDVGTRICRHKLQASLYTVGTQRFRLPWAFCLLEPADLVRLYDEDLFGPEFKPVQLTQIDEDEWGYLSCTSEDWSLGRASPTAHTAEVPGGFQHNYNADPGDVDPPTIFEGPAQLAGTTGIEVMAAVRGTDPNWGGAHVWVSLDGTEYRRIGTIHGGSRFGLLNGALTSGSTTINVDGLDPADELASGSAADAAQLQTLCYLGGVDTEFFAYQTATLTGSGAWQLTGLVRGAYGSGSPAHADNVPFVRVDDRVARSGPLEAAIVGQPVYIKCCSFNIYGRATQSLADVAAYAYTVTGEPAGYMPGVAGKGVSLQADSQTFTYPKAGGVNPGTITLTASRKGSLQGAVVWSVVSGTATLTDSGDTRTLTAANLDTDAATIRASITDGVGTYTSDVTITKVRDGIDGTAGTDAPGSTGVLINWLGSALGEDTTFPYGMSASVTMQADGTLLRVESPGGSPSAAGSWYTPTTTGIGSGYEAKATKISGSNPTSGTLGSWVSLPATWGLSGSDSAEFMLSIQVRDTSSGEVVGTGQIYVNNTNGL